MSAQPEFVVDTATLIKEACVFIRRDFKESAMIERLQQMGINAQNVNFQVPFTNLSSEISFTTLLGTTAELNKAEVAEWLLSLGADKDLGSKTESSVCIAALYNSLEVLKLLCKQGADIQKVRTTDGFSPLMIAVRRGHQPTIAYLKEQGATINQELQSSLEQQLAEERAQAAIETMDFISATLRLKDRGGSTRFEISDFGRIGFILERGVRPEDVNFKNSSGKTLSDVALELEDIVLIDWLKLQGAQTQLDPVRVEEIRLQRIDEIIHRLRFKGPENPKTQEFIVPPNHRKTFLTHMRVRPEDVNSKNSSGETLLDVALELGDTGLKDWLLELEANLNPALSMAAPPPVQLPPPKSLIFSGTKPKFEDEIPSTSGSEIKTKPKTS